MQAIDFILRICREAGEPLEASDPLAFAEAFLASAGDTAQGELLRRIIHAIAFDRGDFEESEVWLLSRRAQQLVSALVQAKLRGQYTPMAWARQR